MNVVGVLLGLWLAVCCGTVVPALMDTSTVHNQHPLEAPTPGMYCPSWCDPEGVLHASVTCISPPYCCNYSHRFNCCNDKHQMINASNVEDLDQYNCDLYANSWISKYSQMILGICLPLGLISLIGSLSLCGYMAVRDKRRRRARNQQRNRSASRESSWSGSSSSSGQIAAHAQHSLGEATAEPGQPSPEHIYVVELANLSPQPPPYVFALTPPPYTADEPPGYTDSCGEILDVLPGHHGCPI